MSQIYDDQRVEVLLSEHATLEKRFAEIQKEHAEIKQMAEVRIRELEQAVTNLAGMGKRDEDRIRELEGRIRKTRQMLFHVIEEEQEIPAFNLANRVLEALRESGE